MTRSSWTAEDTRKAKEIWTEYQKTHDVSDRKGQAVAIDPITGQLWFGKHGLDAVELARAQGINNALFCIRVGYPTYLRKGGGRRC